MTALDTMSYSTLHTQGRENMLTGRKDKERISMQLVPVPSNPKTEKRLKEQELTLYAVTRQHIQYWSMSEKNPNSQRANNEIVMITVDRLKT